MMHKLAAIAVIGLATSAVCMGAAAAIGGKTLADNFDLSPLGGRPRCETAVAITTSRDLAWDGSDHIILSVPAHAQYSPGDDNRIHASGDPQMLAHLRVRDGTIELDCNNGRYNGALNIVLPGRTFTKFGIDGSGHLLLRKLDQQKLKISIAGSGSIKADGTVDSTDVRIAGSGDADLGQVTSQFAEVYIAGSGNSDITPRDKADIHIAGSGDVNLHSNPRKLESHIVGSGRIHTILQGS